MGKKAKGEKHSKTKSKCEKKGISSIIYIIFTILIGVSSIVLILTLGQKKENWISNAKTGNREQSYISLEGNQSLIQSSGDTTREIVTTLSPDEIAKTEELKKKSDAVENTAPVEAKLTAFDASLLKQKKVKLGVKYLPQNPELPTGCEITSLTTILNFYGYEIKKTELSEKYLQKTAAPADWTKTFVGEPSDPHSFGCYAQPIADAANRYFVANGKKHTAKNASGSSFTDILKEIDEGRPVALWGTIDLKEPKKTLSWTVNKKNMQWISPEHCYVLIGYDIDRNVVIISDPLKGIVEYNLKTVKKRYEQMCLQCVFICELPQIDTPEPASSDTPSSDLSEPESSVTEDSDVSGSSLDETETSSGSESQDSASDSSYESSQTDETAAESSNNQKDQTNTTHE